MLFVRRFTPATVAIILKLVVVMHLFACVPSHQVRGAVHLNITEVLCAPLGVFVLGDFGLAALDLDVFDHLIEVVAAVGADLLVNVVERRQACLLHQITRRYCLLLCDGSAFFVVTDYFVHPLSLGAVVHSALLHILHALTHLTPRFIVLCHLLF